LKRKFKNNISKVSAEEILSLEKVEHHVASKIFPWKKHDLQITNSPHSPNEVLIEVLGKSHYILGSKHTLIFDDAATEIIKKTYRKHGVRPPRNL